MNHDHHRRRHVLLVFGVPRTFEIGIGLLLLVSGWLHIENEFRFYGDILAYRIVGALGATILVTLLPWLHVVVGMAMISGTSFGGCSIIATTCFFAYSIAQSIVLVHGSVVDCGCFGSGHSEIISIATVLRTSLLCFLSGSIAFWRLNIERNRIRTN